jgi:flagellar secretion chaperone FliS
VNAYVNTGAYTEASVLTAPPGRLIVMLYDGAIRFLAQAAAAMRAQERERMRDRLGRAEAIIDELNVSLDMSHGEIPERLRSIYLFCKRELREASLHADPERVETVSQLLGQLRDSWEQLASNTERLSA